jgi:hypothetical protein
VGNTYRKYVFPYNQLDVSGGVQTATSRLLQKRNELDASKNAVFNKKIGSASRRDGYEKVGETIQSGNDSLGAHVYKYSGNNKVIVGINNANSSFATLQFLDTGGYWNPIISTIAPSTRFHMLDFLEECYVVGRSPDTDTYMTPLNIDSTLVPSTTRNVYTMPGARFIDEYGGSLYAMNVQVGTTKYKDRIYKSSAPLGAITFVQNDQAGLLMQLQTDAARYLKVGMQIDIYSAGTNYKVQSAITIVSVIKSRNIITFAPTQINVKDNDEIWLTGRKGLLSVFWNTDYPTPENSDYLRIPPGVDANPEITGHGKNNNRKLFFTRNSTWKWDGANLVNVSETIGCAASETVRNIGGWTIWLHDTGVWGYNDASGQFKLLSRSVTNYIQSINQAVITKASAVAAGRVYKLSVGETATLDSSTTSTSTSSTSTSSTSSSTSSTSTSSTSTSSTSTSTTNTTTSTSSTSTSSTSSSTSSTSTSSTSSSSSTSSTSTSLSTSSTTTQTVASTKNVLRLVYDFDSNIWWPEYHKREFRFQFMHTMNGYTKPYFTDETGRLFRDETGNLDNADSIPFEIEYGRSDFGTPLTKNYVGALVQSEKAKGALLQAYLNGNPKPHDLGQITEDMQEFKYPAGFRGHDINYKIVYNSQGDGPTIDGITTYFSQEEGKVA